MGSLTQGNFAAHGRDMDAKRDNQIIRALFAQMAKGSGTEGWNITRAADPINDTASIMIPCAALDMTAAQCEASVERIFKDLDVVVACDPEGDKVKVMVRASLLTSKRNKILAAYRKAVQAEEAAQAPPSTVISDTHVESRVVGEQAPLNHAVLQKLFSHIGAWKDFTIGEGWGARMSWYLQICPDRDLPMPEKYFDNAKLTTEIQRIMLQLTGANANLQHVQGAVTVLIPDNQFQEVFNKGQRALFARGVVTPDR